MKHGTLLCFGILFVTALSVSVSAPRVEAQAKSKSTAGTISGVVRDTTGIPQLGATVEILAEAPGAILTKQFLTNTEGVFRAENLPTGPYSVRVTLAGFLPAVEKHVQISANLTTVVRVQLESLFASIEQLRRAPVNGTVEPDDWKWVLRSASGMRPVLQWHEEDTDDTTAIVADMGNAPRHVGRIEFTDGARRPGSVSNIDGAPATIFAYDQKIDRDNHLIFAGQVSYDPDAPAGGLATVWLPMGSQQDGPRSTIVLREAKIGPDGPTFRGVRIDQSGSMNLGDRFILRVGGEYVLVGAGTSAWSVRPRLEWETKVTQNWYLDAVYASLPASVTNGDNSVAYLTESNQGSLLTSAMNQLDAFPALLWHDGRAVLENGRHEEVSAERKLDAHSILQIAVFHDDSSHVALFGKGADLPAGEYFQDYTSNAFAYDGGSSVTWGTRAALRERISDDLEVTAIYAFSGALVPVGDVDGGLRDALRTSSRHSAAVKLTGKIPVSHTQLTAGYKWISGLALSRVDPYGEAVYDINPYLHIGVRQPLPWPTMGHWEANAECDNLLAQGNVPMSTRDGQVVLVPAFRSFRGGLSLQF
ncbi:MAG TPA: carboxypeptidase-like regulatory domain-containing protein [Candidatus Acidoferrum sp.]|nr:carboxypeptidase-like regulatory domain-containing protein [Candidatus Acidoferrum sp.]